MAGRSTDVSSAYGAVAVTPNDSTVIPPTRGLMVAVSGAIAVRMVNGDIITFSVVPAGIFTVQVNRVYNTGTTATGIVALY
jgi:hypothetical protein